MLNETLVAIEEFSKESNDVIEVIEALHAKLSFIKNSSSHDKNKDEDQDTPCLVNKLYVYID